MASCPRCLVKGCQGFVVASHTNTSSDCTLWRCTKCPATRTEEEVVEEARRWRRIEKEDRGVEEVPRVVEEMELEGAHPLHHSVVALKQKYLEGRCKEELDKVILEALLLIFNTNTNSSINDQASLLD